jgi:hypothetical protein
VRTKKLLSSNRKLVQLLGLGVAVHAALTSPLLCQTPAFSLNPGKMELEVSPGTEKTAAFEIAAAAAVVPERGRIMVTPTDWTILEDGSLTFRPPGSSEEHSASSWIAFSPSAFTLEAAQTQLVRITVTVPEKTKPGVYRMGLFVQERPSAAPPEPGLRVINVRVRYLFLLYVIVPPISSHARRRRREEKWRLPFCCRNLHCARRIPWSTWLCRPAVTRRRSLWTSRMASHSNRCPAISR